MILISLLIVFNDSELRSLPTIGLLFSQNHYGGIEVWLEKKTYDLVETWLLTN